MGDLISDIIKSDYTSDLTGVEDLYTAFSSQSKVELLKEEDNVLKQMLRGIPLNKILIDLNKRHKTDKLSRKDLLKFIHRNKGLLGKIKSMTSLSSRRILSARADCEEELAGLALFTRGLVTKYDTDEDRSATLGAIKMLNITLMNYMRVTGLVEDRVKLEFSGDDVLKKVNDRHKNLSRDVMEADFTFIEVKGNDEGHENTDTNSDN